MTVHFARGRGSPSGQVEHRAHVVGELGRDRAVLRPVARVVRAHRQFVDQDAAVARLEELDREVADHAELLGDAQRQLLRLARQVLGEAGGGRDHRVADAVDLLGLDDGVGHGLAVRGADDVRRELPHEVDLLLGEHRDTGPEGIFGVLDGTDEPHPLPVIAAAHRLEDHGEAVARRSAFGREGRHVGRIAHDPVARARARRSP